MAIANCIFCGRLTLWHNPAAPPVCAACSDGTGWAAS